MMKDEWEDEMDMEWEQDEEGRNSAFCMILGVAALNKLVMGLGQKILTWVGSAIFGLGLGLENFP